ncbi:MAG: endonuclease/exonuclease/phosphatase family protein [Caldilineaceae bacterium]|nr:endonuclease/exonuclease/phosphatase family protein [Caldilineaceae bacterium]MBP8106016.1 endonuclease/exonuclease/phosphatase family protein [Caldilineaceae bacterium]MBP8123122.1 endonuclease/exonuclease/phosphatase family protein [Caldilineaceae bacterium]MBP9071936.1 endonuclease/exonuclease/phosphatase family protein [Caldilineaceae bacterium]
MRMRVMTYNVHGWLTPGGQPNLGAVYRVIRDSGADIVGLNEVFHPRTGEGSDGQPLLQALAQKLGFHYVFGPCLGWPATGSLPESSYGNALLSRWPIIASAAHHLTPINGLEQRGLLEGRILLPDDRTFTLYVTHLDYTSEENRLVQLRAVRTWTVRDRSRPHLVMGDFNAVHPWDYEGREEALSALAAQPKAAHMAAGVNGSDQEGGTGKGPQVIRQMEKAGYVDTFTHFGSQGQSSFLLSALPLRIDYLFASAPLLPHITGCRILTEMADYDASDHLPVMAEIDF